MGLKRGAIGRTVQTPSPSASGRGGRLGRMRVMAADKEEGDELDVAAGEYGSAMMSPGSDRVDASDAPGIDIAELSAKPAWMKKIQATPKFRSPIFADYQRRASLSNDAGAGGPLSQPHGGSPGSHSSPPLARSSPTATAGGESAAQNRSHLSGVASTLNLASPTVHGSPAAKTSTAVKQSMWEVQHRVAEDGGEVEPGRAERSVLSSPTTDLYHR